MIVGAKPVEGTNLLILNNQNAPFDVGDLVMLTCGGPPLTVVGCSATEVTVNWYVDRQLHGANHPVKAVIKLEGNDVASV